MNVSSDLYLIGIPWGECRDGDTVLSIRQKVDKAVNGIIQTVYFCDR